MCRRYGLRCLHQALYFACRTHHVLLFGYLGFGRSQQNKYCAKQSLQIIFRGWENAANLDTRGNMGWTDCFVNQRLGSCRSFCKLTIIPNDRLVKRVFTWSKSHGKCWEKRFLKFIHEIELSHLFEEDTVRVANTVKLCKSKLIERDKVKWRTNLFNDVGHANGNKLRPYRLYKIELQPESFVQLSLQRDHRRILCSGVAICHYILKLGALLVLNSPLNSEFAFTVKTQLNMKFIFLLSAPFMMALDETCFTKHSYAIEILFYTIRLKNDIRNE